jgi:hypothetical protein
MTKGDEQDTVAYRYSDWRVKGLLGWNNTPSMAERLFGRFSITRAHEGFVQVRTEAGT